MENQLKVLFVASGNAVNFEIAPFIKVQGESLVKAGVSVFYFPIRGRGLLGYAKGAKQLRKYLRENDYDIIHAHYTLAGWSVVAAFTKKPIVLSLMGDDAYGTYIGPSKIEKSSYLLIILTYLIQPFISQIISKSAFINSFVYRKNIASVIPNGIVMDRFLPLSKTDSLQLLNLNSNKKYILFLGDTTNTRKNFSLLKLASFHLKDPNIEILAPYPVSHEYVAHYLNVASVFVLTAFMEGSPNVIKEAMACNCPIVSTRVGDVDWVFGDTEGCYLADFDPLDFAEKIQMALQFAERYDRTRGREQILKLGLDSESVAKKIIDVYRKVLQ